MGSKTTKEDKADHNSTNLFYRSIDGVLRQITYGIFDLIAVQDQGNIVGLIIQEELPVPVSPVLCCILGGKGRVNDG